LAHPAANQPEDHSGRVGCEFEKLRRRGRPRVCASYRFIAFADPQVSDSFKEIDLGSDHPSAAKSLAEPVIDAPIGFTIQPHRCVTAKRDSQIFFGFG
jgi:hypothetical protein